MGRDATELAAPGETVQVSGYALPGDIVVTVADPRLHGLDALPPPTLAGGLIEAQPLFPMPRAIPLEVSVLSPSGAVVDTWKTSSKAAQSPHTVTVDGSAEKPE